jgi:hypothetical protein
MHPKLRINDPLPPLTQSLKGVLKRKKLNEATYKKHLKDKFNDQPHHAQLPSPL